MNGNDLYKIWKEEEEAAFQGWDFSRINPYIKEEPLTWDYKGIILKHLKPHMRLLDMGTGGGEFLLTLNHPHKNTFVTEGYEPNYQLCLEKLAPLGITVKPCSDGAALPYDDNFFDIIINRHESYLVEDIYRLLKPGGLIITQQVGGDNNSIISKKLIKGFASEFPDFDLAREEIKFRQAGFEIFYKNEFYSKTLYSDVKAIVYMAKILVWDFPGFSVDKCFDELLALQQELEENGFVEGNEVRFIICAKKGD